MLPCFLPLRERVLVTADARVKENSIPIVADFRPGFA
jgi:hypothetical protein